MANLTLEQRIKQVGIKARAVIDKEFVPRDDWDRTARHYKVTLSIPYTDHRMVTSYHMGSAHKKPPTVLQVMSSLLSEANAVARGESFEQWADEFGYDTDSRKAESLYRTIVAQTEELRNFLLTNGDPWVTWLDHTDNDY